MDIWIESVTVTSKLRSEEIFFRLGASRGQLHEATGHVTSGLHYQRPSNSGSGWQMGIETQGGICLGKWDCE